MQPTDMLELERRIREEECEALEQYRAGRQDAPTLYRPAGYLKTIEKDGDMVFVANEESEDRMGDVIEVEGWDLKNFKRNPVLMFSHDYSLAPIGTVPKVWVDGKQLLNTVRFDEADPLGSFIKGKYERKVMRAESVGFRPIQFESRESEAGAMSLFGSFTFQRQELLEISSVSIPAHPKALQKAMHGSGKFTIVMPEIPEVRHYTKGERLAALLNRLIDDMATDERTRSDIIDDMADAAGISASTVNQILNGSINCPPLDRLEGFAEVLDTSLARLRRAAEEDGCEYSDNDDERSLRTAIPRKKLKDLYLLLGDILHDTDTLTSPQPEPDPPVDDDKGADGLSHDDLGLLLEEFRTFKETV